MRSFAKSAFIAAATAVLSAASAAGGQAPVREVNVTSDSERGWIPPVELEAQAKATVERFWTAYTSGRADDAYALIGPDLTVHMSKAQYKAHVADTLAKIGKPADVRFVKVTWTKDSPRAPEPGVYVAIDIEAKFESALRYCGYVVLHQAKPDAPFTVSRHQQGFIDDATARAVEAKDSRGTLDALWAQMIEGCPNYRGVFAGMPALDESDGEGIGYASVAAALADLRAKPGVAIRTEGGWTIVEDRAALTFWSFTPKGHPAHPSAVKRSLEQENGRTNLHMAVACEASKAACDELVREFQRMNNAALR